MDVIRQTRLCFFAITIESSRVIILSSILLCLNDFSQKTESVLWLILLSFLDIPHSYLRLGTKPVLVPIYWYSVSGPMPDLAGIFNRTDIRTVAQLRTPSVVKIS